MAARPVTEVYQIARGSLRQEVGKFTDSGGGNYEIYTKLGYIYFVQFQGLDTADNQIEFYVNSKTATAIEDDPGIIHIASGATSGKIYLYRAIGKGG